MTNEETMRHIRGATPLNQVRTVFSSYSGQIEQAGLQRKPLGPVEMRGVEFEAVKAILAKAVEVGLVQPAEESR